MSKGDRLKDGIKTALELLDIVDADNLIESEDKMLYLKKRISELHALLKECQEKEAVKK